MMTSSNGNIFRVTGHLCGEFTGPGEFPAQRPVTRSFDVFFDPRLNKRLSKQSWGWWFETLSCQLWRHCNVNKFEGSFVAHEVLIMGSKVVKSYKVRRKIRNIASTQSAHYILIVFTWPSMSKLAMSVISFVLSSFCINFGREIYAPISQHQSYWNYWQITLYSIENHECNYSTMSWSQINQAGNITMIS